MTTSGPVPTPPTTPEPSRAGEPARPAFPWYVEVPHDDPVGQGDIVDECPVVVFKEMPELASADGPKIREALAQAVKIEPVRAIVMSQACDLANKEIANVSLCPLFHLDDYRRQWEAEEKKLKNNPTEKAWKKKTDELRKGRIWSQTLLNAHPGPSKLAMPHQVVDFHEVFCLPIVFLEAWLRASRKHRLRLLPPYREHLSQSFARFYMRVGLPQDIAI